MTARIQERTLQITVVEVGGQFDAFSSPKVRKRCEELLTREIYGIVLDLRPVVFLDSSGMAVIVNLWKAMRQRGGNMVLILPESEDAARILQLTKFDKVFTTAGTVKDAVARL